MTRDRKINYLILASLVIGILFLIIDIRPLSPASPKNIEVTLGEKFRLKQGLTAKVNGQNVQLSITELSNRPDIEFGGPEVMMNLIINGKGYKYSSRSGWDGIKDFPYSVKMVKTDYETYVDVIIDRPEASCSNGNYTQDKSKDNCLKEVAYDLSVSQNELDKFGISIDYVRICSLITDTTKKSGCYGTLGQNIAETGKCEALGEGQDICLEETARVLHQPDICIRVKAPKAYCLYTAVLKGNDIKACNTFPNNTGTFDDLYWNKMCYKDFAQKENQGLTICDQVAAKDKSVCLEAITGAF